MPSIKPLKPSSGNTGAGVDMREIFVSGILGSMRLDPVNGPILAPYDITCLLFSDY
jgi:hypothetical protein